MRYRYATESDATAMSDLFAANHHQALTERQREEQGFVQGGLDAPALRALAARGNLLLADDEGRVAGFLGLSAAEDVAAKSPPVQALLAAQDSLRWEDAALSEARWLLYGPVVVDADYRGQGVARGLFDLALSTASGRADAVVAFIETANRQSWRVHVEGFGMRPLGEVFADGRTYGIVAAPVRRSVDT